MLLIYYSIDEDNFIIFYGNDYKLEICRVNVFNWLLVGIIFYDYLDRLFVSVNSAPMYMYMLDVRYWSQKEKRKEV